MAVAQSRWATAVAAQWMAGWRRDCDAYGRRQREGNTMEDGDGGGTIAMGDGNGGAMDGSLPRRAVVSVQVR